MGPDLMGPDLMGPNLMARHKISVADQAVDTETSAPIKRFAHRISWRGRVQLAILADALAETARGTKPIQAGVKATILSQADRARVAIASIN